jgi:hypothetical protein
MKACFNQSTKHSLIKTVNAGEKVVRRSVGVGRKEVPVDDVEVAGELVGIEVESSRRFLSEMIKSIKASWNRSTISVFLYE